MSASGNPSAVMTAVETWQIDTNHSSVEIAVRHMGLFTVRGALGAVTGTVRTEGDLPVEVSASIDASGINTGNHDRDQHLRSEDFLHTAEFPTITFQSTEIRTLGDRRFHLTGDLTIRGQSHTVQFEVETVAPFRDPFGSVRVGGEGHGQLSRKEWGLTFNQVMETGSVLVGDEVKFTLQIQAVTKG